jgi:serine/threonine protein kinase
MHAAGVLHRDLKPENILMTKDWKYCKIIDFGIAVDAMVDLNLSE